MSLLIERCITQTMAEAPERNRAVEYILDRNGQAEFMPTKKSHYLMPKHQLTSVQDLTGVDGSASFKIIVKHGSRANVARE